MIRRRRPPREVPFSLDCFLDVITNVVGIIIRLILVAWVGALRVPRSAAGAAVAARCRRAPRVH